MPIGWVERTRQRAVVRSGQGEAFAPREQRLCAERPLGSRLGHPPPRGTMTSGSMAPRRPLHLRRPRPARARRCCAAGRRSADGRHRRDQRRVSSAPTLWTDMRVGTDAAARPGGTSMCARWTPSRCTARAGISWTRRWRRLSAGRVWSSPTTRLRCRCGIPTPTSAGAT